MLKKTLQMTVLSAAMLAAGSALTTTAFASDGPGHIPGLETHTLPPGETGHADSATVSDFIGVGLNAVGMGINAPPMHGLHETQIEDAFRRGFEEGLNAEFGLLGVDTNLETQFGEFLSKGLSTEQLEQSR